MKQVTASREKVFKRSVRRGFKVVKKLLASASVHLMGTITHVSTQDNVVALTFDDGPHPEFTPRLLDILDKYKARATFFCLGKLTQEHPDIIRQAAESEHVIANHTWDHPSFPLISPRERIEQLRMCAHALSPYGKQLFRPPYGHQSLLSQLDAFRLGYQVVAWNVVSYDWLDHDAQWIANHLLKTVRPGSIVLLHDRLFNAPNKQYFDRGEMLQAVTLLLEQLSDSFRFVTVPELLQFGRPVRSNWYWKADAAWLDSLMELNGQGRRYS